MTQPLVTVVTATWHRPRTILEHCLPSVAAQDYPSIEHLVICDGPDQPTEHALLARGYSYDYAATRRLVRLGRNWSQIYDDGGVGWTARQTGCWLARGDWIAYLDDDDDWEPGHLSGVMAVAAARDADLVLSAFSEAPNPSPDVGYCGTSMIAHKAGLLALSRWQPDGYTADGQLVERWARKGARWAAHLEQTATLNGHRLGVPD